MAIGQGYSNQKKKGKAQFRTVHASGSNSYAEAVVHKSLYAVTGTETVISAVEDILGTTGQVEFWKLTIAGHSGQVGGVVRMYFGSSIPNFEFEIISIVNSNNLLVLPISETKPVAGTDTCSIYGWVSAISDSQGNAQVSVAASPISFKLNTVSTFVSKDTAVPANSTPLPTENLIAQASLSSIDGKFTTLNAKDFATSAKQDTGNSSLSSIDGKFTTLNAKDFATSAKQDTGNTSLSGINTNTVNIPNVITTEGGAQPTHGVVVMGHTGAGIARHLLTDGTGRINSNVTASVLPTGASTLAEQQTQTTVIGSVTETAPATDTASSGLNGRLQRIAQRLTSLINLLPSSIGTKTSANSLSVVLASDQVAVGVTPTTTSGTITQIQKAVGLTAVRATVAGTAPSAIRKRLLIKPSKNNTGSIYLGSSAVTTASGLEIIGPDRLEFLLDSSDYFLISDTAAQVVDIIEVV